MDGETQDMPSCEILVVDDDPNIRAVRMDVLQDEGHAVVEAENGAVALELAAQHQPKVIFLDMRMPVLDGWGFVREYKQRPGPHAPIVVMTAAQNARAWCAEVGGDECLPKPFEFDRLITLVEKLAS